MSRPFEKTSRKKTALARTTPQGNIQSGRRQQGDQEKQTSTISAIKPMGTLTAIIAGKSIMDLCSHMLPAKKQLRTIIVPSIPARMVSTKPQR